MSGNLKKLTPILLAFTAATAFAQKPGYLPTDLELCQGMAAQKPTFFIKARKAFTQHGNLLACQYPLTGNGNIMRTTDNKARVTRTYFLKDTNQAWKYMDDLAIARQREAALTTVTPRTPPAREQLRQPPQRSTSISARPKATPRYTAPLNNKGGPRKKGESLEDFIKRRESSTDIKMKEFPMSTAIKFALAAIATTLSTTAAAQIWQPWDNGAEPSARTSELKRYISPDKACRDHLKTAALPVSGSSMSIIEGKNFACIYGYGVEKQTPILLRSFDPNSAYGKRELDLAKEKIALQDQIANTAPSAPVPLTATTPAATPQQLADAACHAMAKSVTLRPISGDRQNGRVYAEDSKYGCIYNKEATLFRAFDITNNAGQRAFGREIYTGPQRWNQILNRIRTPKPASQDQLSP